MKNDQNIAMFGGSFNPPHNGHVEIALRMREEFGIDRVLFIVAANPPHKSIALNVCANTRFALTRAALAGKDGLEASDLELIRGGTSYTVDSLRSLRQSYPEAKLHLIVGEDMLNCLLQWHEPEQILSLATIITVSRPGAAEDIRKTAALLSARFSANIRVAQYEGPDLSSTEIRARVFDAKPISALVPPKTEQLVFELGLYQPGDVQEMMKKLRAALKPHRFTHSLGTMCCAIELAQRFGLDGKKARLAGLLHDCAKLPDEQLMALAEHFGVVCDAFDKRNPGLLHDRVGAHYAREEYGIGDAEILSAIASHTRCEPGMGGLARLIYLADKIEPTRDYLGVDEIRLVAQRDMDRAVLMCMQNVLSHLVSTGMGVQPNLYDAIEELKKLIESKEVRH